MITREFNLYLHAGHSIPLVINVNQYDQGEQWLFTLFNSDGTQYVPSSGAIVGIKSDNLGIINSGSVDAQGRVVINETQQMTAAVGKAVFELLIDDQTHGTANFIVLVEPKPGDNADLSESDLSLIQQAIDGTSATAIAQGVSDWMDENLTPTTPVVDASLTVQGAAADSAKVGQEISDLKSQISSLEAIPRSVKLAMDTLFQNMVFKNADVYTNEQAVFHAWASAINVVSISAVFTQTKNYYPSDLLDRLKDDLVVTASFDDGSTAVISGYTLSGTLTLGTSTITVSYGGKSTTFNVTVTVLYNLNYVFEDIELTDGYIDDNDNVVAMADNKVYNEFVKASGFCLVSSSGSVVQVGYGGSYRLVEYDSSKSFIARKYVQQTNKIFADSTSSQFIKMGFANTGNVDLLTSADRFVALNVLDTTLCTIPNMNVDADGNEVASTDNSLSDYLPINNDGYVVMAFQNGADTGVVAFFDTNKSIISRHGVVGNRTGIVAAFAVPTNAKYVRFRCHTTPDATQYISYVR